MEAQKQAKPAKAQKGLSNVRGIKNAFLVIVACFVVAVTAAFLLFWLVGSGNTFINWAKAAAEIRRQEKMIEQYGGMMISVIVTISLCMLLGFREFKGRAGLWGGMGYLGEKIIEQASTEVLFPEA